MKSGLFPRLAFSPDESHISWAGRLAAFHTGGGVEAFLKDMRIPRSPFLHGHSEFVRSLCSMTNDDPNLVLNNTILRDSAVKYRLRKEVFGSGFLIGKLTRFCPMCLLDDDTKGSRPHAQRREHLAWRFRSVHVCPIHNIFLFAAPYQNEWVPDLSVRVPATNEVLKILSDQSETVAPSPLQSYLLNRITGAEGPEWLDGQAIDQATQATERLGAVMEFGREVNFDKMSAVEWHRAGCVGWEWTKNGEEGLLNAFQTLQAVKPSGEKARVRHPGYMFGKLYSWLAAPYNIDDRGPIRDVLRKHIIETEAITSEMKILGTKVRRNRIKPRKIRADSSI